jgi:hypothetical protein
MIRRKAKALGVAQRFRQNPIVIAERSDVAIPTYRVTLHKDLQIIDRHASYVRPLADDVFYKSPF